MKLDSSNGQDATQRHGARSWVRTVYLYLVSVIAIILITIAGIRLLDLALKAFVFRAAEQEERLGYMQPPMPYALDRVERLQSTDSAAFTADERIAVRQWLAEYDRWETQRARLDPIAARRQRDASSSLAMLIIGLPLYLYHWGLIRREGRRRSGRSA
jgi:hypothetical protein